ncbi:MAG: insulinase family protein [Deltaproteobacteria bacterium]|nr:insulinase family protein [Deltaproteobacteria bacterium]
MRSIALAFAATLLTACPGPVTPVPVPPVSPVPPRPELGPSPEVSFPVPETFQLANGLEVNVLRVGRLPLLTLVLVVGAGQAAEPPGLTGVADFTAEMLKEGTGRRTGPEVMAAIEDAGGSFDVLTDRDSISLYLTVPTEQAATAIGAFAEMITDPAFPEEEIEKRRARELARLMQSRADPNYTASVVLFRELYGEHPYAHFDATPEAIALLQREHLVTFHHDHFAADGAFLVAAGDADAATLRPLLEAAFGAWRTGAAAPPPVPEPPAVPSRHVLLVDRPDSVQSTIHIGFSTVPMRDPDWLPVSVANEVLGGDASSRLFVNLRDVHGWTYGAYSSLAESALYAPAVLSSDVDGPATGPALLEMIGELRRVGAEPAPPEELAARQAYMTRVFPLRLETPFSIAGMLATRRLNGLPDDYWDTYRDTVLAVGPDAARAAAARWLPVDRAVVVVVGVAAQVLDACRAVGSVTLTDIDGNRGETFPAL